MIMNAGITGDMAMQSNTPCRVARTNEGRTREISRASGVTSVAGSCDTLDAISVLCGVIRLPLNSYSDEILDTPLDVMRSERRDVGWMYHQIRSFEGTSYLRTSYI